MEIFCMEMSLLLQSRDRVQESNSGDRDLSPLFEILKKCDGPEVGQCYW